VRQQFFKLHRKGRKVKDHDREALRRVHAMAGLFFWLEMARTGDEVCSVTHEQADTKRIEKELATAVQAQSAGNDGMSALVRDRRRTATYG
jgi:hypothetical protein